MFKVGDRVWNKKKKCLDRVQEVMYESYVLESDIRFTVGEQDLHQTAQTMFEELGYDYENDIKNERIIYKWKDSLEIIFSLKEKEVWLERIGDTSGEYILEIKEHLAIHQKLIELGWIE
jgi:hypothetical protein